MRLEISPLVLREVIQEHSFKRYRRVQMAELRHVWPNEKLSDRVSVSAADREAGSPKPGDMIARNPKNHDDQWLVAADYFADNFELQLTQLKRWTTRETYVCSRCAKRWPCVENLHMPEGMVYMEVSTSPDTSADDGCFYFCAECWPPVLAALGKRDG